MTVIGFALTTASLLVIVVLAVHALPAGLPYYHPILLRAMGIGILTALAGMIAALIGTGQLENPTIAISGLCLLIWFVEAMAQ